jgi:hypothetical protein
MRHVVVLATGDDVELHWQQEAFQPTVSEVLTQPVGPAGPEAVHHAIVRLSPWMAHSRRCARVTAAAPCDCGLQAELRQHRWSI